MEWRLGALDNEPSTHAAPLFRRDRQHIATWATDDVANGHGARRLPRDERRHRTDVELLEPNAKTEPERFGNRLFAGPQPDDGRRIALPKLCEFRRGAHPTRERAVDLRPIGALDVHPDTTAGDCTGNKLAAVGDAHMQIRTNKERAAARVAAVFHKRWVDAGPDGDESRDERPCEHRPPLVVERRAMRCGGRTEQGIGCAQSERPLFGDLHYRKINARVPGESNPRSRPPRRPGRVQVGEAHLSDLGGYIVAITGT